MNLRSPLKGQQLLFLSVLSLALAGGARGQDLVIMQDRQQPGKVLGVSAAGLQIQIGQGSISLPLASIKEVRLGTLPPEFAAAQKALMAKNFPEAQTALKALEKYRGLPAEWAQQATGMVGDLYIEMGQIDKAEAAYKDFQRLYPAAAGGPQAEVGLARLAVAKKDFDGAKQKLEPLAAKAIVEKNVPANLAYAYSQVFYLLGQIKEAGGDLPAALEDYLRTVTLFYGDRAAVALAQEKADSLRKAHPELFIP